MRRQYLVVFFRCAHIVIRAYEFFREANKDADGKVIYNMKDYGFLLFFESKRQCWEMKYRLEALAKKYDIPITFFNIVVFTSGSSVREEIVELAAQTRSDQHFVSDD